MKITSATYGDFYLRYYKGTETSKPYYKVWIVLDKPYKFKHGNTMILWLRPSWLKGNIEKSYKFHKAVPNKHAMDVRTIRGITLEKHGSKYLIMATMDDVFLYYKTHDILRTVEILEHIWAKL
jgi:hypothetical protein